MSALTIIPLTATIADPIADIAAACVARLSHATQRAYSAHIHAYLARGAPLSREHISQWLHERKQAGAGPVTLNIAIAAIKLLAREVWLRGLLDGNAYNAIADIRSERKLQTRLGQWTDEQGVEQLLEACADLRERALIAVMCGCGLRRAEVASLRWSHYQERVGRMCIVDLLGKGGRMRTVAVPSWASEIIDEYRGSLQL